MDRDIIESCIEPIEKINSCINFGECHCPYSNSGILECCKICDLYERDYN